MNVLIVGKGGREHALGWKMRPSPALANLYFMPGNAGTAQIGTNINVDPHMHIAVLQFCQENSVGLVVIGPDEYLADGLTDFLSKNGVRVFGPTKVAATLEWSKSFAKTFMQECDIPTATHRVFTDADAAIAYLQTQTFPIVIKADGLAFGKGVIIAEDRAEAKRAIISMLEKHIFGAAGDSIIIEEYLMGKEISVHAFCDGNNAVLFPPSQDHKRRYENDAGPNTGGMGVVAPLPRLQSDIMDQIKTQIIDPTLRGMRERGTPFVGILFPGVMVTREGPKVIEFNARFGDPETQSYMPLLKTDLLAVFNACVDGTLATTAVDWHNAYTCGVTLVSDGYPGAYEIGHEINGLDTKTDALVFHAGTAKRENGKTITAGGRVLNVVAMSDSLSDAIAKAYTVIDSIEFSGMRFRKDIGQKAL